MSIGALLLGLVFGGIGVFTLTAGGKRMYQGFALWRSNPVSVREAAQDTGTDEFEGTVQPVEGHADTFTEPFTGEEALLSTYTVEERKHSGGSRRRGSRSKWRTKTDGTIRRPFLVEDDSGCVEVDPTDAELSPANETTQLTRGSSSSLPDSVRLRLSVLTDELDLGDILAQNASRRQRYSAGHIEPGESVHIYGTQLAAKSPQSTLADARVESCEDSSLYRITAGDESRAVRSTLLRGFVFLIFGAMFGGTGALLLLSALL